MNSQSPEPPPAEPVRRTGGRSARVCAAVHRAVTELIAEGGAEQLSIPVVAARAGVNPTSVYRRWGDLNGLLADVTATRLAPEDAPPDTGGLRTDLLQWAERSRASVTAPENLALVRHAVGQLATCPGPGSTPRMAAREQQLATILARAAERGEPTPTLRQGVDHLLAPLYFRIILNLGPVEPADVRRLVDDLLRHHTDTCTTA
ncbi:TetR family transcriptional regulator [Kitasatospora phosalacinea]|uniref:TetR family transcriptional regulator n=1 Tax=Kitasatospora phosalacinea TaxID=2065 RepID=A0A9W6Q356_9ACTN|nr:TetR/AcrR family transcriptional regulator [Kitasatospora phosalacinea]GLW67931.1 TetR family transcriptional regulator [Kitasatospora phosalacinea]